MGTRACRMQRGRVSLHFASARATLAKAAAALVALGSCASLAEALGQVAETPGSQPVPPQTAAQSVPQDPEPPPARMTQWYNPLTWPFLPIPEIITDPNSGTTIGLLPTWLITNEQHYIDRIIAPDIQYNQYFGWGGHARILDYPSADVEWSAVAGGSERVQRKIDLEYLKGRLREHRFSYGASLVYIRDGTARYYGLGNSSPLAAQTNYTSNQSIAQVQAGLNLSHAWQLSYTLQWQQVQVLPGVLPHVPSIETLFGQEILRTDHELLHQLAMVYDSRDDVTLPTRGMHWVAYGGVATDSLVGTMLYSEAGVDGSGYWRLTPTTILAAHLALRYMPSAPHAAFWELSSLGGGLSVPGGVQPLRGFGSGRFTDRNLSSGTLELRQHVAGVAVFDTHIAIEVTPFMDVGRVFASASDSPVSQLHTVYGVGFRGVAAPFIVGYVDVGHGSEGVAVFTGVNYPF
jgi:surface antigen Omp85-like protein